MTAKRLAAAVGVVALIAIVGVLVVGTAFAQSGTPGSQATPMAPKDRAFGFGKGPGFWGGGSMADFDAMAKALNLPPTQLFEQLHSGKTLAEIAQAQNVDLTKVQEAANATRITAMKDRINQAFTAGAITKAQADWLLQGLDNVTWAKAQEASAVKWDAAGCAASEDGPLHGCPVLQLLAQLPEAR